MTATERQNYDLAAQYKAFLELKRIGNEGQQVNVGVVDGAIDISAKTLSDTKIVQNAQQPATMHGTIVANVLAGALNGVAPQCTLHSFPAFAENAEGILMGCSEIALSNHVTNALRANCSIINVSGANPAASPNCHDLLRSAIEKCRNAGAILVAATGNQGRSIEAIPASINGVLAVGSHDRFGTPADFNNFGPVLASKTLLVPGVDVLSKFQHNSALFSGSSFAAPFVSGLCALIKNIAPSLNAEETKDLLWQSSIPTKLSLGGGSNSRGPRRLDLVSLLEKITAISPAVSAQPIPSSKRNGKMSHTEHESVTEVQPASAAEGSPAITDVPQAPVEVSPASSFAYTLSEPAEVVPATVATPQAVDSAAPADRFMHMPQSTRDNSFNQPQVMMPRTISPQNYEGNINSPNKVFVLGKIGYDFLTEANYDYFKNIMQAHYDETQIPAIPTKPEYMAQFLNFTRGTGDNKVQPFIDNATALTWTLKIDNVPIFAIQPDDQFAIMEISRLIAFLFGQCGIDPEKFAEFSPEEATKVLMSGEDHDAKVPKIDRVSIPGHIKGEISLYNGQVVQVIDPVLRGMFSWDIATLVKMVLPAGATPEEIALLENFMSRIYYELRNRGTASSDRALNFIATNCFSAGKVFSEAYKDGMRLSSMSVERSPVSRPGGDFWDVVFDFFDPKNIESVAHKIFRQTVDVSEIMPVTIGQLRSWDAYPRHER